uniref:Uncharacterized protein n=1 Tax=Globodera rostochiensis TaxID=31243 RepID=A0A914HZ26_GLORO
MTDPLRPFYFSDFAHSLWRRSSGTLKRMAKEAFNCALYDSSVDESVSEQLSARQLDLDENAAQTTTAEHLGLLFSLITTVSS